MKKRIIIDTKLATKLSSKTSISSPSKFEGISLGSNMKKKSPNKPDGILQKELANRFYKQNTRKRVSFDNLHEMITKDLGKKPEPIIKNTSDNLNRFNPIDKKTNPFNNTYKKLGLNNITNTNTPINNQEGRQKYYVRNIPISQKIQNDKNPDVLQRGFGKKPRSSTIISSHQLNKNNSNINSGLVSKNKTDIIKPEVTKKRSGKKPRSSSLNSLDRKSINSVIVPENQIINPKVTQNNNILVLEYNDNSVIKKPEVHLRGDGKKPRSVKKISNIDNKSVSTNSRTTKRRYNRQKNITVYYKPISELDNNNSKPHKLPKKRTDKIANSIIRKYHKINRNINKSNKDTHSILSNTTEKYSIIENNAHQYNKVKVYTNFNYFLILPNLFNQDVYDNINNYIHLGNIDIHDRYLINLISNGIRIRKIPQ